MHKHLGIQSQLGLENHGLTDLGKIYWSLNTPLLLEQAIARDEGQMAREGGFVATTGQHTGRSPNDKFTVINELTEGSVWWGTVNKSITPEQFEHVHQRMLEYYKGKDIFVQDTAAGTHPEHQLSIRVITTHAWHSMFARNMFLELPIDTLPRHQPEFVVLQAPGFEAIPEKEGTNSKTCVLVDFERKLVLIGGTSYAGEIKKSIFTVLNFMLPAKGVLPMHCSANVSDSGEVALFFGLSGTGKTTLSSDVERSLIGDDEHGWADDGIFNFEGGSYAKVIRLRKELEPLIWNASRRIGTILENVVIDPVTRAVDYDDNSLTENTRASYPIDFLPNHVPSGRAGHPNNVFFLTADAFGVLPPISKLTPEQAQYHFISGYTSKLAGTEKGLGKEPQATFSACFGAPFLPQHPKVYADLLGEKVQKHGANVWLVNTGWTGGAFGQGERINLPYTRSMIKVAMEGALDAVPMRTDPNFGLAVPEHVPDVPDEVLDPRQTWADGDAYDAQAANLVERFIENFKQFESEVPGEIVAAGPSAN
ncbi:MAG: phosphoenolpyruvate carboxykinase (ATP) [Chloroflexi bacterium]|nr:MAG: phosphoenolpyruvate carboxykinase (ATP) [Chloroflexota bacterium]MBL1193500.1 phosphoenolpyruvate carboxykinase (ATP) [Chloroflexota bacterium]NOH10791.1 phosphoenolpyruvate carboxykinase (ATP) [Chloroflexota bacterium]